MARNLGTGRNQGTWSSFYRASSWIALARSVRFVKLEVGGPFGPQREQGPPQLSQLSEVGGAFFKRHPSRATA